VITEPPPPPPVLHTIVATSHDQPAQWRFTTTQPAGEKWFAASFDDQAWQQGPAGFGTPQTPNTTVRTTWNTPDIWLRRTVDIPAGTEFKNPALLLHHDEDADVYINGTLAARVTGYNGDYEPVKIDTKVAALLKPGPNTIAVHCHQTTGGQFIDLGIVDIVSAGK